MSHASHPNLTLFDLDGTLIEIDSDHAFGEYMVQIGWADATHWRSRNDAFYADYKAGTLDVDAYVEFATSAWRDRPQRELLAARDGFMQQVMGPALQPAALELVRRHQAAGDLTAIVTATNEFVTAPLAEAFGVAHLIAVQLERDANGRVTGAVHGVPSFRRGKIARVDDWLASLGRHRGEFDRITFYSDSLNDLPLLELVSDPVVTNGSAELEAIARERGWRILKLFA